MRKTQIFVSAPPIGPSEFGRNNKLCLCLPARYNYALPDGFQEVNEITRRKLLRVIMCQPLIPRDGSERYAGPVPISANVYIAKSLIERFSYPSASAREIAFLRAGQWGQVVFFPS